MINNCEFLNGDFSDDDFVKDPDFVFDTEDSADSSDENDREVETINADAETIITNNSSFNTVPHSNENVTSHGPYAHNIAQRDSSPGASTDRNNLIQNGRPKKGRKQKNCEYTLSGRKKRKYDNLPYITDSKKVVAPKIFRRSICSCYRQCFASIPEEDQKREFYNLRSFEAQLLYLVFNVKETKAKRHYVLREPKSDKRKSRECSRKYNLCNTEVCKDMFLKTFKISCRKIDVSLKKIAKIA